MAEIKRGFGPPPEVTSYFEDRAWKPSFSFKDVFGDEHATGFAVAKVTELELGTAFKTSIAKAIAEGQGFENWRKGIVEDLAKIGWGGPRLVDDPTGRQPARKVDFTAPRRLTTIFWGNMASARAAGQWERAQRTKRALPFFLYVRTTSGNPRKDHLQWVGIIRPVDDPIWAKIFPPNGWLCKCSVRQISAREAEELLGREWKDDDTIRYTDEAPEIEIRKLVNKRTGEVIEVPVGCDPGWGGNPGLARVKGVMRSLEQSLIEAAPADATKALEDLWQSPWTRVVSRLSPEDAKGVFVPAGVSKELQAQLGAKTPLVSISAEDVIKRSNMTGRYRDGRGYDDLARLPRVIADGVIRPDPRGETSVRSLIWQSAKTWWRGFVAKSKNGYMRVTSLHQQEEGLARRDLGERN